MHKGIGLGSKPWQVVAFLPAEAQIHVISGLDPYTQYTFIMCGRIIPGDQNVCCTPQSITTPPSGQFSAYSDKYFNLAYMTIYESSLF